MKHTFLALQACFALGIFLTLPGCGQENIEPVVKELKAIDIKLRE